MYPRNLCETRSGVPAKFFKNGAPTKSSKLGSRQKVEYQHYQPKYQPQGVPAKFFINGVPAKLSKLGSHHQKVQYQKYKPKYQPPGALAKFFKIIVPAKSSKLGSRQKVQYQKYHQNTNHQVLVPVTYQYQPDSQYW
jgi:hypothetical protein